MKKLELLTIDSVENITSTQLNFLKDYGFCYVKIDNELESALNLLATVGQKFFSSAEVEKQRYAIDANNEGYLNHKVRGTENIQRYIYHGNQLEPTFLTKKVLMDYVREYFRDKISLPVIKKIFENMVFPEHYENTVKNCSASLSFIYYPYPNIKSESGLKAHKDIVLATILFITKPGLEVDVKGVGWQEIQPRPGCVVLNLGNSLELMTGGKYHSALHRVNLKTEDARLTIASFLGPNPAIPLVNYTNGQQMYADFSEFFKEQIKIIYSGYGDKD